MEQGVKNIKSEDRFMPCVLERLTDKNPQINSERYSRGVSIAQLKQDVLWNIELILNSRSHPSFAELDNDGELNSSVLGMGLPDFCGISHSAISREQIRKEIIRQLICFEPRIDPDSLEVNDVTNADGRTSILNVEVRGVIKVYPLREEFVFRAKLDLESGNTMVNISESR